MKTQELDRLAAHPLIARFVHMLAEHPSVDCFYVYPTVDLELVHASPGAALLLPQIQPGILGRCALPAARLARLGATPDSHHRLLDLESVATPSAGFLRYRAKLT